MSRKLFRGFVAVLGQVQESDLSRLHSTSAKLMHVDDPISYIIPSFAQSRYLVGHSKELDFSIVLGNSIRFQAYRVSLILQKLGRSVLSWESIPGEYQFASYVKSGESVRTWRSRVWNDCVDWSVSGRQLEWEKTEYLHCLQIGKPLGIDFFEQLTRNFVRDLRPDWPFYDKMEWRSLTLEACQSNGEAIESLMFEPPGDIPILVSEAQHSLSEVIRQIRVRYPHQNIYCLIGDLSMTAEEIASQVDDLLDLDDLPALVDRHFGSGRSALRPVELNSSTLVLVVSGRPSTEIEGIILL